MNSSYGFVEDGTDLPVAELIMSLKMAFRAPDFSKIEKELIAREEKLKLEIKRREEEIELLRKENEQLQKEKVELQEDHSFEKADKMLTERLLKESQTECSKLKTELENSKQRFEQLDTKVTSLEKDVALLSIEGSSILKSVEVIRAEVVGEKGGDELLDIKCESGDSDLNEANGDPNSRMPGNRNAAVRGGDRLLPGNIIEISDSDNELAAENETVVHKRKRSPSVDDEPAPHEVLDPEEIGSGHNSQFKTIVSGLNRDAIAHANDYDSDGSSSSSDSAFESGFSFSPIFLTKRRKMDPRN